jgi:Domain of unknown function (DUF3536)/Glycosyl hydrolase family 57
VSRGAASTNIEQVNRPRLAVHGHFYQPERRNPFSGEIPPQPAAAPYRDWNARIDAECYKPNAERGNLSHVSYDLGPTLATWLAASDAATHQGFVDADTAPDADGPDGGNAMAQAYHHSILPLASLADRRTEIRWGMRDFELRFDRRPTGIWLPETAVDTPTLRILAAEGIRYTILAPWQATDSRLDTRRPYRVDLGGGRSIVVVFYDAALSASASFESDATMDADAFARDRVLPRLDGASFPDGTPRMAVIATDGELYGHHQKFRDLFLARLVNPGADVPDRGFDVTTVGRVVGESPASIFPATQIAERTSWSCHHGVLRWYGECPDAADGRWKAPLRVALERLAASIDTVAAGLAAEFMEPSALWQARDSYVDVIFGAVTAADFARGRLPLATPEERNRFLTLMEAERWRLAMFASDGWFWGDPIRLETKHVLLCAAKAVRLIDSSADTALQARLVDDLSIFTSPSRKIDGAAIYAEALEEAGQPAVWPEAGSAGRIDAAVG